jgi:hypothetical protein
VGEDRIEKHLERFLVSKNLVEAYTQIRQWIGFGGISYHSPIFIEISLGY